MDEIDRELASALSIEPSPEFRARVRARIASEPAPRSWYLQWRFACAGAGVATLAVVLAVVLGRPDRLDKAPPLPSTALTALPMAVPAPRAAAIAVVLPARSREPQVLVAPSEVRGLRQLAALVREGRTQFVFPDERASDAAEEPVRDIVIAPIAIAPIGIAANSGFSVNAEGDEQ